jgi:hypothetical protein
VKYRVIEAVKNPEMEKRRYAIGFLGVARVHEALPVLRTILADNEEEDYFRADALDSIFQISPDEGLSLARQYRERGDFLGRVSHGLIDGTNRPFERSYVQALIRYHE